MIKKIISVLIIAVLPLVFASAAISTQDAKSTKADKVIQKAEVEKEVQYTVTKIEGSKVNLQNEKNEKFAMNIQDSKTLQDLKVGDKVLLKNGKVTKQKEDK